MTTITDTTVRSSALWIARRLARWATPETPSRPGPLREPTGSLDAFFHGGGARMTCRCGRTYYDPDGGWDFEPGEIEELEADPKAIEVSAVWYHDTPIGTIIWDCECGSCQNLERNLWAWRHAILDYISRRAKAERSDSDQSFESIRAAKDAVSS